MCCMLDLYTLSSLSKDHPTPTIRGGPIEVHKRCNHRLSLEVQRNAQQGSLKGGPRDTDQSLRSVIHVMRINVTRLTAPTALHLLTYRTTPLYRFFHHSIKIKTPSRIALAPRRPRGAFCTTLEKPTSGMPREISELVVRKSALIDRSHQDTLSSPS